MNPEDLTQDAVEVWQGVGELVVSGVFRGEGRKFFSEPLLLVRVKRKFDQCPL